MSRQELLKQILHLVKLIFDNVLAKKDLSVECSACFRSFSVKATFSLTFIHSRAKRAIGQDQDFRYSLQIDLAPNTFVYVGYNLEEYYAEASPKDNPKAEPQPYDDTTVLEQILSDLQSLAKERGLQV